MVPLDPAAARHVRTRLGLPEGPGLLGAAACAGVSPAGTLG